MNTFNIIMLVLAVITIITIVIRFMKPDSLADVEIEEVEDKFSMPYLCDALLEYVNDYQNLNVEELDMNRQNIEKIERDKDKISSAIKLCAFGDKDSKYFLKELVKLTLTKTFGINEETIDKPIRFDNQQLLSDRDKFDILFYIYQKKWGKDAAKQLISLNNWDAPIGVGYEECYRVSVDLLNQTFNAHLGLTQKLTYKDKLEIIAQRIYSSNWGLGAIDDILDTDVDGVNAGTSGIPAPMHRYLGDVFTTETGSHPVVSYNAIWMFYRGKLLHLAFLGFDTEKEFERVAKKIYKYDNPGTLSADKGGIVSSRMDGSRVTVVRPPAAENWAFFVRKLDAGAKMNVNDWFTDNGSDKIIETLHWVISGCLNLAITGEQGCGKTTLMMSLIDFVRKSFSIRTQEMSFELNLKQKYLLSNILAFRDTPTFSGQQGIDIQKKTDGSVNLMGEVATHMQGYLTIQTGETGSNQVMFTGHMKTAELLVAYFRDCMTNIGGMDEKSAESLCAKVLNTNIHLTKDVNGHRHAERLTMIIPHVMEAYPTELEAAQKQYYYRQTDRPTFESIDLISYREGQYVFTGEFSDEMRERIMSKIAADERPAFQSFCDRMHEEVLENEALDVSAEKESSSPIGEMSDLIVTSSREDNLTDKGVL